MSRIELLNAILDDDTIGHNILIGHRQCALLFGINKLPFHHGLKWEENVTGNFELKCVLYDHLDYAFKPVNAFPVKIQPYLTSGLNSGGYTLLTCKNDIPEELLREVLLSIKGDAAEMPAVK